MGKNFHILFVGYRPQAIKAALRLGLNVSILAEKEPPAKLKSKIYQFIRINKDDLLSGQLNLITDPLLSLNIKSVIALTEKSVVIAAMIRQILNLPGPHLTTAQMCHNKYRMKKQALENAIPITEFELVSEKTDLHLLAEKWGFPIYLKPLNSSGSRLQIKATNLLELKAQAHIGRLAEKFVHGREMSIEVLVDSGEILFFNPTQYFKHQSVNIVPAPTCPTELFDLRALVNRLIKTFSIGFGILHVEVFMTDHGPVLGEFAIRPPGGHIMSLIEMAYGFNPWEEFIRLRSPLPTMPIPTHANTFAAVYIFHPGEGLIEKIEGTAEVKQLESFKKLKLLYNVGDRLAPREGSGQELGHVFFENKNYDKLVSDIKRAETLLKFQLF